MPNYAKSLTKNKLNLIKKLFLNDFYFCYVYLILFYLIYYFISFIQYYTSSLIYYMRVPLSTCICCKGFSPIQ